MRKQSGGNLFSALLPLAKNILPQILKTAGFSALSGAVSGGIEKAIKGEGLFKIPKNKVYELKQYKDYLTETQKKQINKALKNWFRNFKIQNDKTTTRRWISWYSSRFDWNSIVNEGYNRKGPWKWSSY